MITTQGGDALVTQSGRAIVAQDYEQPRGAEPSVLGAYPLVQSVTVVRRTAAGGFAGGYTEGEGVVHRALVRLEGTGERYFAGRADARRTIVVMLPAGTDVRDGDVVVYEGTRHRVLTVDDPTLTADHLEVVAEELHE